MKTVRFGIIGCGLMGREFASAVGRWCHLNTMQARPEIVAICDTNQTLMNWYSENFPSIKQVTTDYQQLLANKDVDAVYCAVPHNLHEKFYCDIISAGKHLLGEKPFGIDQAANAAILACIAAHPNVIVRCSSEFPFFPPMQRLCSMIEKNVLGQIIEVSAGFLHSSDLDAQKPINWKRMAKFNGQYGCMGDLGMHVCHVPFRAGWRPVNVRAILADLVPQRPDGKGGMAVCDTWDNATLLCETLETASGRTFPMTLKTQRIAPGNKNTWYIEAYGTTTSVRWSSLNPKRLEVLEYNGPEQSWQIIDVGHTPAFGSITGNIFEFGFSDSILQMWASFVYELTEGKPLRRFAGCVLPDETVLSHKLFTAALESHKNKSVVAV